MEPAPIVIGKFVGPHLRAVKHAIDANSITVDQVGRDISVRGMTNSRVPATRPGPATVRKVEQAPRGIGNLFINMNRCTGILGFDVAENAIEIGQRESRPDEFHRSCSATFSKRSGTALREMCFDLGIIEIGPGIRQCLAHLRTDTCHRRLRRGWRRWAR